VLSICKPTPSKLLVVKEVALSNDLNLSGCAVTGVLFTNHWTCLCHQQLDLSLPPITGPVSATNHWTCLCHQSLDLSLPPAACLLVFPCRRGRTD
jgi:hypothetical protein